MFEGWGGGGGGGGGATGLLNKEGGSIWLPVEFPQVQASQYIDPGLLVGVHLPVFCAS